MEDTNPTPVGTVIEAFLGALGTRRLDDLVGLHAPEVDWDVPGDATLAPWLGRRSTQDDVRAYYETLWANVEPVSLDVEHLVFDGDHCIITGQLASRLTRTGRVYESMFSAHITVAAGRIVRYRVQEDSWALHVALAP